MFQQMFMKDGRNRTAKEWQAASQIPEQVCLASHQINISPFVQAGGPTTQMEPNFFSSFDELARIPHGKRHHAPRRGNLQAGAEHVRNDLASQTALR